MSFIYYLLISGGSIGIAVVTLVAIGAAEEKKLKRLKKDPKFWDNYTVEDVEYSDLYIDTDGEIIQQNPIDKP